MMWKQTRWTLVLVLALALPLALTVGCDDDDDDGFSSDEATTFLVTVQNTADGDAVATYSGVVNTPDDAMEPGPLTPGATYSFRFGAADGQKLHLAAMMVHSNDLFYGFDDSGLALYDGEGNPRSGEVTSEITLWDAGTEVNQEPGVGPDQPLQGGGESGAADANNAVRPVNDSFTYPAVSEVLQVTLTSEGAGEFTLAMTNVSSEGTIVTSNDDSLAVPVAPAVLAVSGDAGALYTENAAATREGFEALAEAGDPSTLANTIAALTDLASPLAPGVYAVHESGMPIFSAGEAAMGNGLEALAEDGDPSGLATSLSGHDMVRISGVFNTPSGAMDPGPLTPDAMYSFEIEAVPGERLSLATMLVQSNDLFFAFGETGIALFDGAGDPLNGDQTGSVMLWDAGTEANEWPGAGPHQPLRQAGPDTGPDDTNSSVRQVSDGYHYAPTAQMIKVTVEAVN